MSYTKHFSGLETPQTERARPNQVMNNAGGFVFSLTPWQRLERFLILGCEGGTYYATEKKLTVENAGVIQECLRLDGDRTIRTIVEVSHSGRAHKNEPAIFALAVACGDESRTTRAQALLAVREVCRTGTHLFHFVEAVGHFRRFGRGLRKTLSNWYLKRSTEKLALQIIKYQSRDGWSHRDVLRLCHAAPDTIEQKAVLRWATGGVEGMLKATKKSPRTYELSDLPPLMQAFECIHAPGVTVKEAVRFITEGLPHECVPNELKKFPEIWEAMLPSMGLTAMIRNLGKMSSIGMFKPLSSSTRFIRDSLANVTLLREQRVHPMTILLAMKTYASGHGVKGKLTWAPSREIVDALDDAFYKSFSYIEPTGKNHLIALDVSGSMGVAMGDTAITCRAASAAMAMVIAKSEANWYCFGFSDRFVGLPISPKQRLDDVEKVISNLPFQRTDCAIPMLHAMKENLEVDVFEIFTDNETYFGNVHPFQALRAYRQKSGRPAKLVVVGMTATEFTIADPNDAGTLDVVGFDANAPSVMADFVRTPLDSNNG